LDPICVGHGVGDDDIGAPDQLRVHPCQQPGHERPGPAAVPAERVTERDHHVDDEWHPPPPRNDPCQRRVKLRRIPGHHRVDRVDAALARQDLGPRTGRSHQTPDQGVRAQEASRLVLGAFPHRDVALDDRVPALNQPGA
jgi:hypothetical protein